MEFFRSYGQPNLPEDYTYRVFGFDVHHDDNPQYSKALKDACTKNAGPKPPRPPKCPRCGVVGAVFTSRVCYKAGIAGAWNMICFSCHQVHLPNQRGPSDEALQQIEAVRARDNEAFLERKAKKAKQRAKARAKPRKDSDETAGAADTGAPFGILNNAMDLLGVAPSVKAVATSTAGGRHKKVKGEHTTKVTVAHGPTNYLLKGVRAHAGKSDDAEEKPRTVELIYWAQDQDPMVNQVPVQFGHELFLYEFEHFQKMRAPCLFERYSFEASLWCDLPWNTSPIYVAPEDDVIFIRAMGIRCKGFGRQLHRYQRTHGLALSPALGIRAMVDIPPARHQWLVVWGPRRATPEVHLVDLSIASGLDDETRLALPWAHLIADAPFLLIYRETETGWAAVAPGISSGVLEAPMTLVAHPSAETLVGSGEAIAWLEEWRMGGGPRSRASSPSNKKEGHANRCGALPASGAPARLALATSSSKPLTWEPKTESSARKTEPSAPSVAHAARKTEPSAPSDVHAARKTEHSAPSVAHAARKTEPSAPSVVHAARKTEHSAPSVAHAARKTEPSAPSVVHAARKTEHFAPSVALPAHGPSLAARTAGPPAPSVALAADKTEHAAPSVALPAHGPSVAARNAGPSAATIPLPAKGSNVRDHTDITPKGGQTSRTPDKHTPQRGAHGLKRATTPSSDDEVEIVEGPPAKKIRLSKASDRDVEIIDGPCPAKPPAVGTSHQASAVKNHACDSAPGALVDEDVILIEHPSAALKLSFTNKARAPAPSAAPANIPGPSAAHTSASASSPHRSQAVDLSDDEVEVVEGPSFRGKTRVPNKSSDDEPEFVEGASIVPKRRISNVNGRQVIDLT